MLSILICSAFLLVFAMGLAIFRFRSHAAVHILLKLKFVLYLSVPKGFLKATHGNVAPLTSSRRVYRGPMHNLYWSKILKKRVLA
jgi:hypothetical protein